MKALTFHGKGDIRCDSVPDPKIEHGRDAIIKVTSCAICGSDLHIFDGVIPSMETGDILGHETMGEVVELGADNKKLKMGDRVVVPFIPAANAISASEAITPVANDRILIDRGPKSFGAIRPPAFSVIPTYLADTAADK